MKSKVSKSKAKAKPRSKSSARAYLYMQPFPRYAPKFWPKDGHGEPAFVGITVGGSAVGWCIGRGDNLTRDNIRFAKALLRQDYPKCTFREET